MQKITFFALLLFILNSCGYTLGYRYQKMPGNINKVEVPLFKNDTLETGQEVLFTNELVRELQRAGVAQVVSKDQSKGRLEGRIVSITYLQTASDKNVRNEVKTSGLVNLPDGTSLATEYLMKITVELKLVDRVTRRTVWKQWFRDQLFFPGARLALEGINTSTPLYNISERERVTARLARIMMNEAVGRLTENF